MVMVNLHPMPIFLKKYLEYNKKTEEVKIDQKMARYIHTGRWTVDSDANQMVFFQDDNTTVIARYNLFDSTGAPSVTEVFDRVYSGSV